MNESEILSCLLSAFWLREFVGDDVPSREDTLKLLKNFGAFPSEYFDDENPPRDEFEFLATLPPEGYDEAAPECYGELAWSILDGVEIAKDVFGNWCEAHDHEKPLFWFGKGRRQPSTAKAKNDCRRWLEKEVPRGKSGSKNHYWRMAREKFPGLSRNAFNEVWAETVPTHWKMPGAIPKNKST